MEIGQDTAAGPGIGRARAGSVGLRWTVGDVSERGFEALRLSVWGAWKIFGPSAAYAICINTVSGREGRERAGELPPPVRWIEVRRELPPFLEAVFGHDMAEGVAWKLAPLRVFADRHEIALDNDCILWELPPSMATWLASDPADAPCLMAQDVRRCCGQFAPQAPREPINSGLRGLPPGFDLAGALREAIARRRHECGSALHFSSELDEQGLQATALSIARPVQLVRLDEVTITSPFHPHLPWLGRCGAHFVGLNARHIAWDSCGRPADECMTDHWERHRATLYANTGAPLPPAASRQASGASSMRSSETRTPPSSNSFSASGSGAKPAAA
jgi:hypothetical protein